MSKTIVVFVMDTRMNCYAVVGVLQTKVGIKNAEREYNVKKMLMFTS